MHIILKLFISNYNEPKRMSQKQLLVNHNGAIGDKYYGTNSMRSILMTSKQSYNILKNENIITNYGNLGENVLVDYNISILKIGNKLLIGDTKFIVRQKCTLCYGLTKIHKDAPTILKNRRGIFVQALHDGVIKKNDSIKIL